MTDKSLSVPSISCDHCKNAIEGSVRTVPGVRSVAVDVGGKRVDVSFDEGKVDLKSIVAAIEDQGYDVSGEVAR